MCGNALERMCECERVRERGCESMGVKGMRECGRPCVSADGSGCGRVGVCEEEGSCHLRVELHSFGSRGPRSRPSQQTALKPEGKQAIVRRRRFPGLGAAP